MKYSIELAASSSQEWLDTVMVDFDAFLIDHADCERKASAMAMSMVARYPNRPAIIPDLIEIGIEELEHFRDVFAIMKERGINLPTTMTKDPYIQQLLPLTHGGTSESRFMSNLLLGSVVECRGCERFKMVSEALEDESLKRFYKLLWTSEAKHGNVYVEMALNYFDEQVVYKRLEEMMEFEAGVIQNLELRAALH